MTGERERETARGGRLRSRARGAAGGGWRGRGGNQGVCVSSGVPCILILFHFLCKKLRFSDASKTREPCAGRKGAECEEGEQKN